MKIFIFSFFLIHFSVLSVDEINEHHQLVHYIWMGEIGCKAHEELLVLGPTSLAKCGANVDIFMWVPESLLQEAHTIFKRYPKIQIKSVDQWLKNSSEFIHIFNYAERIEILLGKMDDRRSFTAQKDLLSFAIMAELGGYYFDCTTKFTAPITLPPIESVKVALTADDRNLMTRSPWEYVDIWAFASIKGHTIFQNALRHHLETPTLSAWDEDYTGQAASCFGLSLADFFPNPLTKELKAISWLKEERNGELTGWRINDLFLVKYNAGLWRKCPKLNAATYLELGITKDMLPDPE